jgi:hypothetical protein
MVSTRRAGNFSDTYSLLRLTLELFVCAHQSLPDASLCQVGHFVHTTTTILEAIPHVLNRNRPQLHNFKWSKRLSRGIQRNAPVPCEPRIADDVAPRPRQQGRAARKAEHRRCSRESVGRDSTCLNEVRGQRSIFSEGQN